MRQWVGPDPEALFARQLAEAGVAREAVGGVEATGYARQNIRLATSTITEIRSQEKITLTWLQFLNLSNG